MAHLVTVTDLNNQQLLFNLDTAISFEQGHNGQTIVTTRWGRTDIQESLKEICDLADASSLRHQQLKKSV
tara:strand:- start:2230 stop:2439 length:210 start_codon:yes stop_codon:yes gene_type:complete